MFVCSKQIGNFFFPFSFHHNNILNKCLLQYCRMASTLNTECGEETRVNDTDKTWKECQFVKEEEIGAGKWLKLSNVTYTDPHGTERKYEAVRRMTKLAGSADAVSSIPILRRTLHYDCIVMVKQYRPAISAYTIEFPAGLLDPGETPEECALRELKEETGFTGVAKHTSPATSLDAGVGNTTVQFTTVEIDGDLPENENAVTACKSAEGEFTEVIIVPLDDLLERLTEFSKAGLIVDSRVFTYAVSMEQTKRTMKSGIS